MEKGELFQELTFDNAAYATDVRDASEKKMQKVKLGLIIAAAATGLDIIGLLISSGSGIVADILGGAVLFIGVVGAIVAYIIGGGFGTALRWAKKLAVFGWVILPFPADILTGIMAFLLSIVAFFLFPLIFVFLHYRQVKKDYEAAVQYLSYLKTPQEIQ